MAEELKRLSALSENWTHVAWPATTRLNNWAIYSYWFNEKNITCIVVSRNVELLFCVQDVVLGLLSLNIKARHYISKFLNANLWSIHFIALDIDCPLHIKILKRKPLINTFYCIRHRLPIEQLIKLEKVRTENLKFRTDLWDRLMESWSVTY